MSDPNQPTQFGGRSEYQRGLDLDDRRQTLKAVARRSVSAVEFVELVDQLGLASELEELLEMKPEWRTAVTNARLASQLSGVFTVPDVED